MDGFESAQRAYDAALPAECEVLTGPDDGRDVLDTREVDGVEHRVYLVQDDGCDSPRGYDSNAGVMVTVGGPRNPYYAWPAEDGEVAASYVQCAVDDHAFRVVARWLRMFYGATVVLPLYSSGQEGRPAAGDVTDAPEAGDYIGITFDQPSTRRITGIELDDMPVALATDVDEYASWAVGDCFGYVIERATESGEWEETASLWGLVGADYARGEARRALGDVS